MKVKITFNIDSNCGHNTRELIEDILKCFDYPNGAQASIYARFEKVEIETKK